MAMAVHSAEVRRRVPMLRWMAITMVLGIGFLCVKGYEWHDEWVHQHVPGLNFSIQEFTHVNPAYPGDKPLAPDMAEKTQIYYSLYFVMTGMHALHMIIGVCLLTFLMIRGWGGAFTNGHIAPVENFGLYWHFVDIIWIYLFPLLYLISRHQ
jgi:cytochrome c oxidase subunit 3